MCSGCLTRETEEHVTLEYLFNIAVRASSGLPPAPHYGELSCKPDVKNFSRLGVLLPPCYQPCLEQKLYFLNWNTNYAKMQNFLFQTL